MSIRVEQSTALVLGQADKHGKVYQEMTSKASFGESPGDAIRAGFEVQMMGALWQLASSLAKDLVEPLKSIVNK